MSVSPKAARYAALPPSEEKELDLLVSPALGSEPVALDFAANPNQYHAGAKVGKLKRKHVREADRSPRLELRLSLECEVSQLQDRDFAD
ncbi:MAG: hypothetical protein ACRD20_06560 [Terriglobales bacterium]